MIALAIGLSTVAVPVFAEYGTNKSKSYEKAEEKKDEKKEDKSKSEKSDKNEKLPLSAETLACVQTAVDTRDTAIITAFDAYSASVKTALETRKTALKAAWALTTSKERKDAIKKAWKEYTSTTKTAKNTLKTSRKAAWTKFKEDFKACKDITSAELNSDTTSEGADIQL